MSCTERIVFAPRCVYAALSPSHCMSYFSITKCIETREFLICVTTYHLLQINHHFQFLSFPFVSFLSPVENCRTRCHMFAAWLVIDALRRDTRHLIPPLTHRSFSFLPPFWVSHDLDVILVYNATCFLLNDTLFLFREYLLQGYSRFCIMMNIIGSVLKSESTKSKWFS